MNQVKPNIILIFILSLFILNCSYSQNISPGVRLISGAVNGVTVNKNGKNLVIYGDPESTVKKADMILFTHFRRDLIWAGYDLVKQGSHAVVPSGEKAYFTRGDSIWSEFISTRFHDYNNQTTKFGIEPLEVSRFVHGGDILKWQDLDIKVLNTPGYTRGSVSYIIDTDNRRFAFTGDLIYGDGKIFDLYSFQDSIGAVDGYHGYAVRLGQLISSLELIASQKPDIIIPSRGPVIYNPGAAIQKLITRIHSLYSNYLSITANRWNHTDRMEILSDHLLGTSAKVDWMPSATICKNPPSWYVHINNSNLVIADDSSSFLIDCGTKSAFERLVKLRQSGRIKSIDGIFITHYHDDHTNFINNVVKEFDCPVYVTRELKDILENPAGFHMPCLTTDPITDLNIMQNGQQMHWKNFTLTFLFYPGQTLYHDALIFDKQNGETIFFVGDSFTPYGIDDYCLLNRNLLHKGTGYLYCLDILKKLPESILLANQHIEPLFSFSYRQLDYIKGLLLERNNILHDLMPWDNINYGVDEQWVSVYPYSQKTSPGRTLEYEVKIFNHSDLANTFIIKPAIPDGFVVEPRTASRYIESMTEGHQIFKIKTPEKALPGISLLTFDIKFNNWNLHEWSEALIEMRNRE